MATHPTTRRAVLLTLHLIAVAGLLGAEIALLALGIAGVSGSTAEEVYPAASVVAHWVTLPAAGAALLTGIAMAVTTGWSLDRYRWVQAKLTITLVLIGLQLAVLLPRLADAADQATTSGLVSDAEQRQLVIAPAVAAAALLVNAVLGVVKPRSRAPAVPGT